MSVDSDGDRIIESFAAEAAFEGGERDEAAPELVAADAAFEGGERDEAAPELVAAEAAFEGGERDEDAPALLEADDTGVPEHSRKVAPRSRTRRDRPRSRTIALKRLTRAELARGAELYPPVEDVERPHTREDCRDAPRPCPWVACKHHLYLDINPRTGSIKINFPDLEPWELEHTCALDVADHGGLTLEEIGLITNLTRERVRQLEVRGLLTLKTRSNALR
jgi:hypothetical protein